MNKKYFKYMTQEELHLRSCAVIKAFKDNDFKSAADIFIYMAQKKVCLFKFYRPRQHSIQTLLNSGIYMCRPSTYDDISDNKYIPDIKSIARYFVEEVSDTPIPFEKFDDDFFEMMAEQINNNPKFSHYKTRMQDTFLTACITENFDEKMWTEYAQNGEGFCAVYDINQLINESDKLGYLFYPVRYVENRDTCKDIQFSADEYKDTEQSYLSFVNKSFLSCLTKEILPYSSEKEWRLMVRNSEDLAEKGKVVPFIKPHMIIAGDKIGKHPEIEKSLDDVAKQLNIELVKAADYINS